MFSSLCWENPSSSPLCFSPVRLLTAQKNTSLLTLLVTKRVGVYLHNRQFPDTGWVSHNLTRVRQCLLRDSPQVKGSVPWDCAALPHPQMPVTCPGCHLGFWQSGYRSEVPTTPSSGSTNLLEPLTELRETPMLVTAPFKYSAMWAPHSRCLCCPGRLWQLRPHPLPGMSLSESESASCWPPREVNRVAKLVTGHWLLTQPCAVLLQPSGLLEPWPQFLQISPRYVSLLQIGSSHIFLLDRLSLPQCLFLPPLS